MSDRVVATRDLGELERVLDAVLAGPASVALRGFFVVEIELDHAAALALRDALRLARLSGSRVQ